MKKIKEIAYILLFTFMLPGALPASAAIPLRTFTKDTYPLEDTILTGVEPNVLFFLDTSSSMTMSMTGELPTFNTNDSLMWNNLRLMRDANFRASLLKDATYGSGARPLSTGTQTMAARIANGGVPDMGSERTGYAYANNSYPSRSVGWTRWGKDVNASNNVIGNPDSYYSPDPDKPYLLTFRDANAARAPKGRLPSGFTEGVAITDSARVAQLVPNDSKMYQMKLVLWRLLQKENAEMLAGMRIGVAGNFFDYQYGSVNPGAMVRRPPFMSYGNSAYESSSGSYQGRYTSNFRATHNGAQNQWISFPYGTAPESYSGIPGGDYGNTEVAYQAVLSNYETASDASRRHERRAYLRVPFDYMYTLRADGTYSPTSSLIAFRELIDGVEQYDSRGGLSNPHRIVNEELFPGGVTILSSAFYGRDGLHLLNYSENNPAGSGTNLPVLNGRYAVDYARGGLSNRELWQGLAGSGTGILSKRIKNSEGLMTGSAMGSVIDFFSPFGGRNGLAFKIKPSGEADDTRGYFPVTGSCQTNWMVVFTGGNEMSIPGQDPLVALKNLYLNSKNMRGRHWDGEKWIERTYLMDTPIRTIFVGMMPPAPSNAPDGDAYAPDRPTDSGARRLRKAITRMAHAGQPLPDGTPDRTVRPFFADNVPDLILALQSILLQIRTERFAAGAPVILPMRDVGKEKALFASSYQINMLKQWEGTFRKYVVPPDASSPSTLDWEGERLMALKGANRRVYTSLETEGKSGVSVQPVNGMSIDAFKSLTGISSHAAEFRDWLITYRDDPGVMGEMEHSGFALVGAPLFPTIPARDKRIYFQTNRGVLHALDFEDGDEKWAFIPPNIFQNRIREQKFFPLDGSWYTGDGTTTIRSKPLVLLDGMLSARDVKTPNGYKTIMIGNMGWGGNGFYAMDVTVPGSEPNFLWAVENARYEAAEPRPLDGVKLWGAAAAGNKNTRDYSDLGLTIAAGEVRTPSGGDEGVGILPGGLGYQYGADSQGRVFYLFNPEDASIIRKLTTSDGFKAPSGRVLGMGITPVSYISRGDRAQEFFTADSEGNVLYCKMEDSPSRWNLKSIFQLRTLTGDKPVAITRALEVGRQGKTRWLFGGTSDLMAPAHRTLTNEEQFIFGLNLTENRNLSEDVPTSLTTKDLVALKYIKPASDVFPSYGETGGQVSVPASAKGWFLRLRPKIIHPKEPTEAEYVTTSPFLYQGVLYVSTFIARTRQPDDDEKCPELGDSKLYALDPVSGRGAWKGGAQSLVFNNIKVAGISSSNGRMFLGIKVLQSGALDQLRRQPDLDGFRTHADGIAIDFGALGSGEEPTPPDRYDFPVLQFWKENF
ncbi:MAG: hypothetical protein LBQ90_09070 [Synergistaceae bacterium]|jgi:hypothetical protein|nr:hypothetical protein [Synergistaceae bacterium]